MFKLLHHLASRLLLLSVVVIVSFSACGLPSSPSQKEEEEMERYLQVIYHAEDSGNYQLVLNRAAQFYEISKQGHSELFKAQAASIYGQALIVMGKPEEGKTLLDQAFAVSTRLNNDSLLADVFNGMGLYETYATSNAFAAAEYYIKALERLPKANKRTRAAVLSNLTTSLQLANDTTGRYADEFYELSKGKGGLMETLALSHMAIILHNRRDYQQEEKTLLRAYEVSPPSYTPLIDLHMTTLKIELNQPDAAARYADRAVAFADTCHNLQEVMYKDIWLSKAYFLSALGKYQESNQWLDKVNIADSLRITSHQKLNALNVYTTNYTMLGRYKEALECSRQHSDLLMEQTRQERVKILKAKEVALDVAAKNAEIKEHKERASFNLRMLIVAVAFSLMLIGLCGYIYNMYRRQRQLMKVIVKRAEVHENRQNARQQQASERNAELFKRIQQLVETQQLFKDPGLSRESLSALLSTSHTYISEAVRQVTGKSFPQYICDLRQQEAERMLHDPSCDTSILKMLYMQVGFSSSSAFYKSFKKATGMSPSSYLQIIQEEKMN